MASSKPKNAGTTQEVGRSAKTIIGTREVELILTTRLIASRYGGLGDLGQTLEASENLDESLTEVIWLIALLANQSIQIHNLQNPASVERVLTEDEVELLTVPADPPPTGTRSAKPYTMALNAR